MKRPTYIYMYGYLEGQKAKKEEDIQLGNYSFPYASNHYGDFGEHFIIGP